MRQYTLENIVHFLVVYEWNKSVTSKEVDLVFQEFGKSVEALPNVVTVSDGSDSLQYKFPGFLKRGMIDRKEWDGISYQWLREPRNLSEFSAICNYSGALGKNISFYLDEAFCEGAEELIAAWSSKVVESFGPIYGFVHSLAYKWQPFGYVHGTIMGPGYDDEMVRRADFGYVVRRKERHLEKKFRDIYAVNLISHGHLNLTVDGKPLCSWISQGNRGFLEQIGDVTWKWNLSPLELLRVRKALMDCGHLIVSV
jgi:hypothetical protein